METVLILSRTKMNNGVCVGGVNEKTGELIRLHNESGGNLSLDAPYKIGDRWEIEIQKAWNARSRPHIEDRQVRHRRKLENVGIDGIVSFIRKGLLCNKVIKGSIDQTFEGCLILTGNKNYINNTRVPSFSTQFWIADKRLVYKHDWGKDYYYYNNIRIKFVGFQTPIEIIPAGTIVRLSLANWWNDGSGEDRCYIQLSGWYL